MDGRPRPLSGTGLSQFGAAQMTPSGSVMASSLRGWRTRSLVGPIGLAVHVDVVGRVDDAVEDRLGDHGIGEQGVPVGG